MPARIHISQRIVIGIGIRILGDGIAQCPLIGIPREEPCQFGAIISGSEVIEPHFGIELLTGEEEGIVTASAVAQECAVRGIVVAIAQVPAAICQRSRATDGINKEGALWDVGKECRGEEKESEKGSHFISLHLYTDKLKKHRY